MSVENFVERMKQKGISLEVDGKFVKAYPPEKMSVAEVLEMQKLNKKDELLNYLKR